MAVMYRIPHILMLPGWPAGLQAPFLPRRLYNGLYDLHIVGIKAPTA